MTDKDLYIFFLSEIRKERTHVVNPDEFNILINAALLDWVDETLDIPEFSQPRIDAMLPLTKQQTILYDKKLGNSFNLPDDYLRGIRIDFILQYKDNECEEDGSISKPLSAKLLKADRVNAVLGNVYTEPLDSRLYFRYMNKKISLYTGIASGNSKTYFKIAILEYYKYPDKIKYEETGPEKELEFGDLQMQRIGERCAQRFLQINQDPSYQTYLREQSQRIIN